MISVDAGRWLFASYAVAKQQVGYYFSLDEQDALMTIGDRHYRRDFEIVLYVAVVELDAATAINGSEVGVVMI